jgi:hypothetical protein
VAADARKLSADSSRRSSGRRLGAHSQHGSTCAHPADWYCTTSCRSRHACRVFLGKDDPEKPRMSARSTNRPPFGRPRLGRSLCSRTPSAGVLSRRSRASRMAVWMVVMGESPGQTALFSFSPPSFPVRGSIHFSSPAAVSASILVALPLPPPARRGLLQTGLGPAPASPIGAEPGLRCCHQRGRRPPAPPLTSSTQSRGAVQSRAGIRGWLRSPRHGRADRALAPRAGTDRPLPAELDFEREIQRWCRQALRQRGKWNLARTLRPWPSRGKPELLASGLPPGGLRRGAPRIIDTKAARWNPPLSALLTDDLYLR